MARQRLVAPLSQEENATRQTRRSRTRSVASTAPPPSGARLTRGLGEVLAQPCDNTHAEAPPPIATREPRQRRQTSFFTVGAAPPPRTHAVSRRPAAKKQTVGSYQVPTPYLAFWGEVVGEIGKRCGRAWNMWHVTVLRGYSMSMCVSCESVGGIKM